MGKNNKSKDQNKNKKNKKNKNKNKLKFPIYNTKTALHKLDLCTDQSIYYDLKQEEDDIKRKLKSFKRAGDSDEEIRGTTYAKELASSMLNVYRKIKQTHLERSRRFSTAAITQFVGHATHAVDMEGALMSAFRGTKESLELTEEEYNFVSFLYKLGQADLQQNMVKSLFNNEKISSNMKLLAQLKEFISGDNEQSKNNPHSNKNQDSHQLNINLTKKKQKAKRDKPTTDNEISGDEKTPPLQLVN